MALMYSFPSPLEAPVMTAVTMENGPFLFGGYLLPFILPFSGQAVNVGNGENVYNFFGFLGVVLGKVVL